MARARQSYSRKKRAVRVNSGARRTRTVRKKTKEMIVNG